MGYSRNKALFYILLITDMSMRNLLSCRGMKRRVDGFKSIQHFRIPTMIIIHLYIANLIVYSKSTSSQLFQPLFWEQKQCIPVILAIISMARVYFDVSTRVYGHIIYLLTASRLIVDPLTFLNMAWLQVLHSPEMFLLHACVCEKSCGITIYSVGLFFLSLLTFLEYFVRDNNSKICVCLCLILICILLIQSQGICQ